MSNMNASHGKKRKSAFDQNGSANEPNTRKQKRSDENKVITDINVEGFAESRAVELQALTEVVKKIGGNHMAFQKLPKHMRRRAMSHNIKRVPRRLHQAVKSELEKTKPPGKRPSRKYRRRPRHLLAEYERRKRKIGWLETHIWHAKRFKMVQKWNYKVPLHPNEKSIRACYRAVNRYCLMQDVSYESYIEIKGPKQTILDNLSHLTSDKTGLTFAAKMTLSGARQGKLMLYTYDGYPFGAIGQVTFLWQAKLSGDEIEDKHNYSTLWICCHPSFNTEALVEINKCFNKTPNSDILSATTVNNQKEGQNEVSVVSLKDHLVKFRLYGPASNLVLSEVLQLSDIESKAHERESVTDDTLDSVSLNASETMTCDKKKDQDIEVSGNYAKFWWKDFYSSITNRNSCKEQADAWSQLIKCQSPAEAPSNCVIALTVRDPRVLLPPKKNKVFRNTSGSVISTLPTELFTIRVGLSPLWDAGIREKVKTSKISELKLNEMKSQQLLPGSPLHLKDKESRIPVILIQRPGTSSMVSASSVLGYASGWDIIIPSGWAMAFWVALVYRGARVGGIREAHSIALQAVSLCEPFDFPDTLAGKEQLLSETEALQSRYDHRPPAKRPNFTKLGFQSPFILEFNKLVNEWSDKRNSFLDKLQNPSATKPNVEKGGFYVLRDRKCLRLLNSALTDTRGFLKSKDRNPGKVKGSANVLEKIAGSDIGREMMQQHSLALVPVHIRILQRGVPAAFSHICLPSLEDLDKLEKDKTFGGPVEAKHKDPEEPIRREERKLRLQLRRKKKRGNGIKKECIQDQDTSASVSGYMKDHSIKKEMAQNIKESADAPIDVNKSNPNSKDITDIKLLGHTSRNVCGFVRNGDFDFGKGHGSGLGFCPLVALLRLLEQQGDRRSCLVLVRNNSSLQYRFASLSVVI